jgi:hypothetical protein
MAPASTTVTKAFGGEKKKTFQPFGKKQEEKGPNKLPILKYGKGNNFKKFQTTSSEAALEEYGDLGRLIKKEQYYLPASVTPDCTGAGLTQD